MTKPEVRLGFKSLGNQQKSQEKKFLLHDPTK